MAANPPNTVNAPLYTSDVPVERTPVGKISDAKVAEYDFKADVGKDASAASEHVVVVRVYDRYENLGAAKILVTGK